MHLISLTILSSVSCQIDFSQFDNYSVIQSKGLNPIDPSILRNPIYLKTLLESCKNDEQKSIYGSGRCKTNSDCKGLRTCSIYYYCQGEDYCNYTDPCQITESKDGFCLNNYQCRGKRTCGLNQRCVGETLCPNDVEAKKEYCDKDENKN